MVEYADLSLKSFFHATREALKVIETIDSPHEKEDGCEQEIQ